MSRSNIESRGKSPVPSVLTTAAGFALAKKKITGCLLCRSQRLAFVGAVTPCQHEQALWFDGLRPGAMRMRFFGLCPRCFKKARRSNMGNVDAH
jgi:hypothetical protein